MNTSPNFFTTFKKSTAKYDLPAQFTLMQNNETPHPLCILAAEELQDYLQHQDEWQHNFGLAQDKGTIIGKMFGVLVVQNQQSELGYLAAFSGKLAGSNQHYQFVPPVFDLLTENSFLNIGMKELSTINLQLKTLEVESSTCHQQEISELKVKRKQHSIALQNKIFDQYHFLNQAREVKSIIDLFAQAGYKKPPAGAGECAGPKLLQYAFQNQLKPIALSEFWWGLSPKSATWKHKSFYACCKEKCEPILAHMLAGLG